MRRKNLRTFLFISLLIILSGVIVTFRNIDLPGDSLDRGGSGPLGLVLGLDLRGGAHLVYQAQSPTNVDVVFSEPFSQDDVEEALVAMGYPTTVIAVFNMEQFSLDIPGLPVGRAEQFVKDLEEQLVTVTEFSESREGRTRLEIRIKDPPNETQVAEAIHGAGFQDAIVTTMMSQAFRVENIPEFTAEQQDSLRDALDQIFPLLDFQLGLIDEEVQARVLFRSIPEEVSFEEALADLGHGRRVVITHDGKNFSTTVGTLDEAERIVLEEAIVEEVPGADHVDTLALETTLIDLTFERAQDQGVLENALIEMGHPEAFVTASRGADFSIDVPSVPEGQELTFESDLTQRLAPATSFVLTRDDPTLDRMEGVVDTIQRRINAFGITEPVVQLFGNDRVLVQLPGASDTNIEISFKRNVSEEGLKEIVKSLDLGNTTIDALDPEIISNGFVILIQNLTQEPQEDLRVGLEEEFGAIEFYEFNEATGRIDVLFRDPVEFPGLQTTINSLGFSSPVIGPALGDAFRIRLATLGSEEQEELRQQLAQDLSPINSFEISGGVEEAKNLIGQTAQLVFKERKCLDQACTQFSDREAVGRSGESLTGDRLVSAFASTNTTTGLPIVNFAFDGEGTRIFRDLTSRIAGDPNKCIAHVLDEETIICPVVQQPIISGSGFIEGPDFTFDRVRTLSIQLASGSLPVSLELVRESTVNSILGDEALKASLKAGLVGLGLIVLYMVVYYRMAGVVASLSLVAYAVIILAVFKMVPVTITLSGLAGLILSIGMAVDANILIFERLKEELRSGRSLLSGMEIGFRRAWPAIRDSNISTFITCGILFYFGRELGEPRITGFAVTLAIGVSVSMFTAIMISRNLLQLLSFSPVGRNLSLFSPDESRRSAAVPGGEK